MTSYLRARTRNFPTVPPQSRRKVVEEIARGAVFRQAIEACARETGFAVEDVRGKAKQYVKEIASDLNYLSFPIWDFVLSWVFNKVYDGLIIDKGSLLKIKAQVGKAPIVLVPNHRSHIDYMLLSYVFYYEQIPMPYVCAGKNMNFWPFGSFFRRSGAFFIRRRFEGNRLYQAALYAYMHYLLKEKALLEFFIEGTRSRTGKLLPPRLGILSLIIRAYQEQKDIENIVFVPTSVVYESVIEETSYSRELEGATKKQEGFWDVLRIRKYLRGNYGKVYVCFGEPISLNEYSQQFTDEQQSFIPKIANQIGYSINRHTVVTPSSLLAMVLLAHPYPIITEEEIEERFNHYVSYLKYKEAPVSDMVLSSHTAIRASLQIFSRSRLIRGYQDPKGIFYRIPFSRRRRLEFSKNMGVHFFISAAAVSNVLLAAKENLISKERIEEEIIFLRQLFTDEFRFSSRKTLPEHIQSVLDFFEHRGGLHRQSDSAYQITDKKDCLEEFAALLDSTIALYWGLFSVLSHLPDNKEWQESDLLRLLSEKIRHFLLRHHVMRHEALSHFSIRTALITATRVKLLEANKDAKGKRIRTRYRLIKNTDQLQTLTKQLERYVQRERHS